MLRGMKILPVLLAALFLTSACRRPAPPLATDAWDHTLPAAEVARICAEAHGIKAWDKVQGLSYTFHAQVGGQSVSRAWTWEPKADRVTSHADNVTYTRDQAAAHAATDANFINDRYWLLFPFHLLWDKATLDVAAEPEPLPVGEGMGRRLTATYPADGGYTPGDAYDLYLDTDGTVLAWIFRKGNQEEPTRMAAWTDVEDIEGLRISVNRPGPDPAAFRIWFSGLRVD